MRVIFGLLGLLISAFFPRTNSEVQVPLAFGSASLGAWLERVLLMPWMRYDAWHYYAIVDHGYSLQEQTANFHPLFPLLAALVKPLVGGNVALAMLLVATVATVALYVLLARYVERFYDVALARRSVWLLLLVPPGFILLAPYTESTFMALAVGALFAMRVERWWLAGLLGALATLTRQQGVALALPMAWGLLLALRAGRARLWHSLALALIPLGYAAFVIYRGLVLGDLQALGQGVGPLELLHRLLVSQAGIVSGQRIAWPWELLFAQFAAINTTSPNYHLQIDLLLGWALIGGVLLSLRRMHMLERLYVLPIIALALCYYIGDINPYMALPRHIMLAFPLYIVLAAQPDSRWRFMLLTGGMLLVNLFLAGLYFFHGWVP